MISAGEVHMPGRPRDVVGLKAMAIFAQRAFWTLRPGGVKVHAGAPVIESEMVEEDFKELAAAGVKLLGEVGLGGVKDGPTARKMVGWARKYGIQSTIHTGGPSIPGSGLIDEDVVLEADTDVVGHIDGGHTALPDDQIRCICEGCKRSDDALRDRVMAASKAEGERMWPLPLEDDYKDYLKSAFADVANVGGRYGGAVTAALFLKEFSEDTPWVHLDIAGTAWLTRISHSWLKDLPA